MSSYLDLTQRLISRYSDKMTRFSSYLFKCFNLNHFWYWKLTSDGNLCFSGCHAAWTEYFADQKLYLAYPHIRHPKFLNNCVRIIDNNVDNKILKSLYEQKVSFGMNQSLIVVKKIADYIEEYGFASSSLNEVQTSLFINNLPIFEVFIGKFKAENKDIVSFMENNKINIAELVGPAFFEKPDLILPHALHREFLKSMGIENPLTCGENDVLKLLLQGNSACQIGGKLYRSKRTIEHRIEKIMDKLNCFSRSELIQKGRELEQVGLLGS